MGKRSVKSYAAEFKESSAKLAATSGKPMNQIAKELGVNATTLYGWVKQYYPAASSLNKGQTASDMSSELAQFF